MLDIRAYSLKRDGEKYLSKNFQVKEFACSDGSDTIFVSPKLVLILQQIRTLTGRAVTITSGYRTWAKNCTIPDASDHSQHLYGLAADIKVKGMAPRDVAELARKLMPDFGGVGIYPWGVHIDVREAVANWTCKAA